MIVALLFGSLSAQTDEVTTSTADSKIEAVTVFLSGAQVQRNTEILLRKGRNEVYFEGLGDGIVGSSIQVKAPSEVLINSVVHEIDHLSGDIVSEKARPIKDSIDTVLELIQEEKGTQGVLEDEKQMLLKNQAIASKEKGLNVNELIRASDFFRTRFADILKRLNKSKQAEKNLKQTESRLRRQFAELKGRLNQPSHNIKVILNTYSTRRVPIELKYLVTQASWSPRYDLRAKDTASDIQLDYKADVVQTTGVNWDNVMLTLSSGNPRLGGQAPDLNQWNLYLIDPVVEKSSGKKRKAKSFKMQRSADDGIYETEEEADEIMMEPAMSLADYTTVSEGTTTTEFNISVRQSIEDGSKPQQVTVQSSQLPASYRHFAIPKLDKDAFLLAELTNWEALELLPGPIQVFFEGTYVTESYLDPELTSDTLRFSLGRDKRLVVQREKLTDYCKTRVLGSNREKTSGYEFRIRNTKSEAVKLRLEDQIPVSQDKSIEVKVEEMSGASLNQNTGLLFWELELQPGESKTLKLVYAVKHPKNKIVPGI